VDLSVLGRESPSAAHVAPIANCFGSSVSISPATGSLVERTRLPGSAVAHPFGSSTQQPTSPSPAPACPSIRLQHGIRKPKTYIDGTVRYGLLTCTNEPCSVHEALGDDRWKNAMNKEVDALQKNNTWHLVPRKPGTNIIDCKWVYRVKRKAEDSIDRYKA
jgi:hypothetical protein